MTDPNQAELPLLILGPMLRRVDSQQVVLQCATSQPCQITLSLTEYSQQGVLFSQQLDSGQHRCIPLGQRAYLHWIQVTLDSPLPVDTKIHYDLSFSIEDRHPASLRELVPTLLYEEHSDCHFFYQTSLTNVMHGSCRKPHYDGDDALAGLDGLMAEELQGGKKRPDLLIMTGDQVYTDDVCGPLLQAIHQTVQLLGLHDEKLEGAVVNNASELFCHPLSFYQREQLLPGLEANEGVASTFFAAKRKPVFTSVNAQNHLISAAEMIAMYLLVWSPQLWRYIEITDDCVAQKYKQRFAREKAVLETFIKQLESAQRVFAHMPTYMIFDDHDVTDDWNLTRSWEEAVYGHPFSKRIIGNALLAYSLFQGWGNDPETLAPLAERISAHFSKQGIAEHDALLDELYEWPHWDYKLDTSPVVLVLDTRTQRWRSESNGNKPSGLMDWEALCELQQNMIGQQSVIMVSAAPIYGVKLIEAIQKVFTFFGKALMVDAENWMAHKGTASVILNIFRHIRTPPLFVILSGDVHYSFVYDVSLRFRRNSPRVVQFTCSGIKNCFPNTLLRWLDRLNQLLFAEKSPLNWFTRRRYMRISHRYPEGHENTSLLNQPGLGLLEISNDQKTVNCSVIDAKGHRTTFLADD
ncbi:alkaline phosphatase family protein [Aestuariibacter salexigens]|uniref:alkaline phosphatase family protein n=1 Tax=Aestuariibacter salexigens TaxID=226010 RepID=UPI0012EB60FC|nr:alkaline phosphatase family protein [Aestuariibacter salexigens]